MRKAPSEQVYLRTDEVLILSPSFVILAAWVNAWASFLFDNKYNEECKYIYGTKKVSVMSMDRLPP
jgi:hypothetical protein